MPLLLERRSTPTHWTNVARANQRIDEDATSGAEYLRIALVNNMPDAAIEDTEAQFFGLLDSASHDFPVSVELFSLPKICRGEKAQEHLDKYYKSTRALSDEHFDGAIITGTEPKQANLQQEAYWDVLADVFKWGEENTFSTVLSCLAAHAGVLFSDGIARRPLGEKRFGVFEHKVLLNHPLTLGVPDPICIPHSRWNELEEHALQAAGYSVLTKSPEAGVDLFVKHKKQSLFVHFQGHPEYSGKTPFQEYRRDVRRFLRKERETYPNMPRSYFDESGTELLTAFEQRALSERNEQLMQQFPDFNGSLQARWRGGSVAVYRNWLEYLRERKAQQPRAHAPSTASLTRVAQLGS